MVAQPLLMHHNIWDHPEFIVINRYRLFYQRGCNSNLVWLTVPTGLTIKQYRHLYHCGWRHFPWWSHLCICSERVWFSPQECKFVRPGRILISSDSRSSSGVCGRFQCGLCHFTSCRSCFPHVWTKIGGVATYIQRNHSDCWFQHGYDAIYSLACCGNRWLWNLRYRSIWIPVQEHLRRRWSRWWRWWWWEMTMEMIMDNEHETELLQVHLTMLYILILHPESSIWVSWM